MILWWKKDTNAIIAELRKVAETHERLSPAIEWVAAERRRLGVIGDEIKQEGLNQKTLSSYVQGTFNYVLATDTLIEKLLSFMESNRDFMSELERHIK